MSAREEVLARIRAAHAIAPPDALAYGDVPRAYRTVTEFAPEALVEVLVDRLVDYRALVRRCREADLAATLARALADRGADRLVAPPGLPRTWLAKVDAELIIDEPPLGLQQLDAAAGVITGCAVAVAATGTLILDGSAGQGRRVISLIPDYHLCVVLPGQIVGDVPEALPRLEPTRPLTMISGPSATSDIELDRVEGVHGPRTLEVIVVSG